MLKVQKRQHDPLGAAPTGEIPMETIVARLISAGDVSGRILVSRSRNRLMSGLLR